MNSDKIITKFMSKDEATYSN